MKRKYFLLLWVLLVIFVFIFYYLNADFINQDLWYILGKNSHYLMVFVYILVSFLRGFFLIPATPFIIIGTIFFSPIEVFVISVTGLLFSATMIYYFSSHLGFDKIFEKGKNASKIVKIKEKLSGKFGFCFIAIWTCLPITPTDLICYVSGVLKIDYKKFILAILVGDIPVTALYVYLGDTLIK